LLVANNELTELDIMANTELVWFDCASNKLSGLDVTANTKLTTLRCINNQLTSIDVSKNIALNGLVIKDNYLTELDVSNNTDLTWLDCENNQLTSLYLSNNPNLQYLYVDNNQLASVNLKNGNATNFKELKVVGNNSLTCIQVDDIDYATYYWQVSMDANASFSLNCGATSSRDFAQSDILIYPNPSSGHFIVSGLPLKSFHFNVFNMLGSRVYTNHIHQNTYNIDLSHLPTGIYFVNISNGEEAFTHKIEIR